MASEIDNTIPIADTDAEAEPIRANFAAAKSEIEALQEDVGDALSRSPLTDASLMAATLAISYYF